MNLEMVADFERERERAFIKALEADLTNWSEPVPLVSVDEEPEFPVNVLPPIMREAILEYANYGQQPLSLIASTALSAASLAVQGLVDVAIGNTRLIVPTSLAIIVVAKSGERKSSCDTDLSEGILAWEENEREKRKKEWDYYQADHRAWKVKTQFLENEIKKALQNGQPTGELEKELRELSVPIQPPWPNVFLEDVSLSGLRKSLAREWPSAAIWSAEGGTVLNSHATSDGNIIAFFSFVNKLWGKENHRAKRSSEESHEASGKRHRLSICLQIQPEIFRNLIFRDHAIARSVGFLSRFLITWPKSKIGKRPYTDPGALPCVDRFNQRIYELLERTKVEADSFGVRLNLGRLPLSVDAHNAWIEFHEKVEKMAGADGELSDFPDLASKLSNNLARLAGIFHVIEHGPEGVIEASTIKSAIQVMEFFIRSSTGALRRARVSNSYEDAEKLVNWLARRCLKDVTPTLHLRIIARDGPSFVRSNSKHRERLLKVLENHNAIHIEKEGRRHVIRVNPWIILEQYKK